MTTQWVTDIAAIFLATNASVKAVRVANGLPALNPSGDILIGHEWLAQEHDAPRVVIVPKGTKYEAAKPMQNAGATGYLPKEIPDRKYLFLRWLTFDAHFWGEPDPAFLNNAPTTKVGNPLYDFNSTLELERQFFSSLQASVTIPMGHPSDGEWVQPTDNLRRGRQLTVAFRIGTPLTGEPYTQLPYSVTSGDGGVVRDVYVTITPGHNPVGPEIIPTP